MYSRTCSIYLDTIDVLRHFPVGAEADEIATMRITGDQWFPAHLLWAMIRIFGEGQNMVLHGLTDLDFERSGVRYAI